MRKTLLELSILSAVCTLACAEEHDTYRGVDAAVPVQLEGRITDLLSGDGLPGVSVCIDLEPTQCTDTDVDGNYTIESPGNASVHLVMSAPDYVGLTTSITTQSSDLQLRPLSMATTSVQGVQESLIGAGTRMGHGGVVFSISNGIPGDGVNVPNIAVSLDPEAGAGPFYTAPSGLPMMGGTETSTHGGGLFVGVAPGDYVHRHEGLPDGCVTLFGLGPPSQVNIRVLADHITVVRIECAE